mmetsp:Transcript_30397/g.39232  ORF Transcript_30397/g.39232 Transcript_30397/m.39232 type:complete len:221 (-) Transcript_30397:103-765(-)
MDFQEIDEDYEERMLQFEIDCNDGKGNPMACQSAGEYFSVVKNDLKKAAKIYAENCSRHNFPPSCFNLGRIILSGRIENMQDTAQAKTSFETACEGKHTQACYHLALMLLHGIGDTKKDIPKAHQLLDDACKESDPQSCYLLANQLLKTTVENRDPARAKSLLEVSCDRGHAPSCFNLAVMYKNGDTGVPSNQEKFKEYKNITEVLVKQAGGSLQGIKKA